MTLVTEEITSWNIEKSFDNGLDKRAHMIAALISSEVTTNPDSYAEAINTLSEQRFPFVPLLLRITDPNGKVITELGDITEPMKGSLDRHLRLPEVDEGRFDTINLDGVESIRIYTISVTDSATQEVLAFVQAGDSLAQVNETKHRLWRNAIIIGLVGSLLTIAAGLFFIQRGFRPLNKILMRIDEADYNHLKPGLPEEPRPLELQQLADSLDHMWRRLDMEASAKQQAFASVSHDLRTPLTVIQGQLEVLLMQGDLNVEVKDSLKKMLNETRRLIRMVKSVLLNAQLESNPAVITKEVNLRELLDEVVEEIWILAEGLEFNVVAPEDIVVNGDHDLLKQMTLDIVDNAIKFTPKGGLIELKLGREKSWAILKVSDSGPGIPAENLTHITEAFYKADNSRTSMYKGAGLGLAIVRQIVELHSGYIDIQSQEGIGTIVTVRLLINEPNS